MSESPTLVLGGTGFLGRIVVREALRSGPVVSLGRRSARDARLAEHEGLVHLEEDLIGQMGTLSDRVVRRMEELHPERVVLCAALSRMGACEHRPRTAHALNAHVPVRIRRVCEAMCARLVHVSTDLVFGGVSSPAPAPGRAGTLPLQRPFLPDAPEPRPRWIPTERPARGAGRRGDFDALALPQPIDLGPPYHVNDPVQPLSVYGHTKALGEKGLLSSSSTLVVRLPLLYGPSGGTGAGASDSLLVAVARGERSRLFTDEWRTPLSVVDAARAILALADTDATGILHVGGPERVNRYEFGRRILLHAGHAEEELERHIEPVRRADLGLDRIRPEDVSLDSRRARALLPFELSGIEAGLSLH